VHGTPAILAAIDKRVTVTSTFTENKILKINSQLGTLEVPISSSHEKAKSEFKPFIYLANKMINSHQDVNGLEITINSDIPIGVGLGSSSACCVAATASISGLFKELSSEENLKMSIEAEKTIFPDTSGADCTVCTYGGIIEYDKINGSEKNTDASNLNLLIVNSMIPHSTKRSVEKVSKFKESNEDRFSQLCVSETKLIGEVNLALKNKDLITLGLKMSENQKYLEEIQVSNDTLHDMISSLKEISLGAKITGAGDGGCIIALVKDENLDKVPALLGKDKECFSAKIDTRGVKWSKIA
ncbi:MAG TPA: mevalonate kinase, partial [Candidatus Nitrosopelagicus sp.]|nr:mevalonate kinase [Candidatus Nitrosopelagicus sp.]